MAPPSHDPGPPGSSSGSSSQQSKRAERWARQAAALRANLRRRKGVRYVATDQNPPADETCGDDKTQSSPQD